MHRVSSATLDSWDQFFPARLVIPSLQDSNREQSCRAFPPSCQRFSRFFHKTTGHFGTGKRTCTLIIDAAFLHYSHCKYNSLHWVDVAKHWNLPLFLIRKQVNTPALHFFVPPFQPSVIESVFISFFSQV
jgi:hypothetical protein